MIHKLEEDGAYFLVEGTWLHECFLDFIITFKEELK
jgi:hypothetical protein